MFLHWSVLSGTVLGTEGENGIENRAQLLPWWGLVCSGRDRIWRLISTHTNTRRRDLPCYDFPQGCNPS